MAELYGKATGCCAAGRLDAPRRSRTSGCCPAIAIVGGGNTVVTGLGLAFKLRRSDQVAACFFGEGATNEGAFHEGLNFAAVQRLPDRLRLREQPLRRVDAVHARLARRGRRRARGGLRRAGADRRRHGRARRARGDGRSGRRRARAATGRRSLECKTYRFTSATAAATRAATARARRRRSGRSATRSRVLARAAARGRRRRAVEAEVEAELDDAVEFARNSPDPDPARALDGRLCLRPRPRGG